MKTTLSVTPYNVAWIMLTSLEDKLDLQFCASKLTSSILSNYSDILINLHKSSYFTGKIERASHPACTTCYTCGADLEGGPFLAVNFFLKFI